MLIWRPRSRSISLALYERSNEAGEMLRLRGRQMSMTVQFSFNDFLNNFNCSPARVVARAGLFPLASPFF